jgi:hypothetical protein
MAVVDTVTISADGEWIPAPSGSDTTTILATCNAKSVFLRAPATPTNGRQLKLVIWSPNDSVLTLDERQLAVRDEIKAILPVVVSQEPVVFNLTYASFAPGAFAQWMVESFAIPRDVNGHVTSQDKRSALYVISNSGWVNADTLAADDASLLSGINNNLGGENIRASGNATIEVELDRLQERCSLITGYAPPVEWDNGPDGVIKVYATLKNNSVLTTVGTSYTITVSVAGGAGQTTASIANAASAATIQAALEALSNVGAGNVKVDTRSTRKFLLFSPTLGRVTFTATGATAGESLGEVQIWQSDSNNEDPTLDKTQYDHFWNVPATQLAWFAATRFSIILRANFSGADSSGAYIIMSAGYGPPMPYGMISTSETTTPVGSDAPHQFRFRFTGSSPATWSVPDQDQIPDFKRRGNGELEYVNAGTSTLTLTRTGINRFYQGGAYATSIVLNPGDSIRLIPDGFNWNAADGMSFNSTECGRMKVSPRC